MSKARKRYNQLIAIKGHQGYSRNPISNKITFRLVDPDLSAKPIRIATGVKTMQEAVKIVRRALRELETGKSAEEIKREDDGIFNPKLKVFWDELIKEKSVGKARATIQSYKVSENILENFWLDLTLNDLKADKNKKMLKLEAKLKAFKSWYIENHGGRLFKKTFVHLKMLIKYLHYKGHIAAMPSDEVLEDLKSLETIIKVNIKYKKAGRVLEAEEVTALLLACDTLEIKDNHIHYEEGESQQVLRARAKLAILFGVKCGMRKLEGLSLKREKVDFKKKILTVWSFKNKQWRDIPLIPEVETAIKTQILVNDESDYLFPMPTDPKRHISGQVFDHIWKRIKIEAEITQRTRYHDLRHTFATLTGEQGWPVMVACSVLDMSVERYEETYCKPGLASKAALMLSTFGSTK